MAWVTTRLFTRFDHNRTIWSWKLKLIYCHFFSYAKSGIDVPKALVQYTPFTCWIFQRLNVSSFQACKESCLAYNQLEKCGCMEYRFPGSSKHGICDVIDKPTSKCLRPSCFLKPIFRIPSIYRRYYMAREDVYLIFTRLIWWDRYKFKKRFISIAIV